MLIKSPDDKSKRIKLLKELQKSEFLDSEQKSWLKKQSLIFAKGVSGEADAIHYLNSYFSESPNHAILHDLRLEEDGQVAQIDHLIIDRTLSCFLLETKSYSGNIKVNAHGEFSVQYRDGELSGIESPLEQSRRHEVVLRKTLKRLNLTGRAGLSPTFNHVIMIHPKGIINRDEAGSFDTSMIIKADQFADWYIKQNDKRSFTGTLKLLLNAHKSETAKHWGEMLRDAHCPADPMWLPDFMKPREAPKTVSAPVSASHAEPLTPQSHEPSLAVCATCGKALTEKVLKFCQDNQSRFKGALYCFEHQNVSRSRKR